MKSNQSSLFRVTVLVRTPDPSETDFPDKLYDTEEVKKAVVDQLCGYLGYGVVDIEVEQQVRARKLVRGPNKPKDGNRDV